MLDDHKEVSRVRRRGCKAEVPIERDGPIVLRVNGKRAHANHVGNLEGAPERIEQQSGTDAAALCLLVNSEAGQHEQRNRVTRHALHDPFGSIRVMNLARDDCVEADDFIVAYGDIGL
jgi:hypothetical protein